MQFDTQQKFIPSLVDVYKEEEDDIPITHFFSHFLTGEKMHAGIDLVMCPPRHANVDCP